MRRALILSPAFARAAKRLGKKNPAAYAAVRETLAVLEEDAFNARLRTHKLVGELSGCWS